jgi:hypothetical protein
MCKSKKLGVSKLSSRVVTLTHTAGCISASAVFPDIGCMVKHNKIQAVV